MIDRCLVAAFEAGLDPVLVLTKADLASADELIAAYRDFDVRVVLTSAEAGEADPGVAELRALLAGHWSVLVGHSGVGKSTLINLLVPGAGRATGHVNEVTGRGRHTSTSSEAFELDEGGWIVDTPGVRSFGLGHVSVADVLGVFPDVAEAAAWCLPLCSHDAEEPSCALDAYARATGPVQHRRGRGRRCGSGALRARFPRGIGAQAPRGGGHGGGRQQGSPLEKSARRKCLTALPLRGQ